MTPEDDEADPEVEAILNAVNEATAEGRCDEVEALTLRLMAKAAASVSTDDPDMQRVYLAKLHEDNGEWTKAEAVYREILLINKSSDHLACRAYDDLAVFHHLLGRDEEAIESARLATEAARREDLDVLLVMARQREATLLIDTGDWAGAEEAVAECLAVATDDLMKHQRAHALVLQALCRLAAGDAAAASDDLDAAFEILEPMVGMGLSAGIQAALARWRMTRARLLVTRGEIDEAASAWSEAIATARHIDSLEHVKDVYTKAAVARMLDNAAESLRECGRKDQADAWSAEAAEIWAALRLPTANA